ncbi:MAG: hypothetical protein M1600_16045 [Firmicutes bacterium]|jgi:hypothetical protein|nr:hypothetical protein [Bacillota bacterium]
MEWRLGPFAVGAASGAALVIGLGFIGVSSGVWVSRSEMGRVVDHAEAEVLARHHRQIVDLIEAKLDPMVQQQVWQLNRRVFFEVDGRRIALGPSASDALDRALTKTARSWVDQDLRKMLAAPNNVERPLAAWAISQLNGQRVAVQIGGLRLGVPLHLRSKVPSKYLSCNCVY